jgi:hypothetical protein
MFLEQLTSRRLSAPQGESVENLILITPQSVTLADIADACAVVAEVERLSDGSLYVGLGEGHRAMWVDPDGADIAEFEAQELDLPRRLFGRFRFYSIRYQAVSDANRLLRSILPSIPAVVDTNFEVILPGQEFLARLNEDPDWDWSSESLEGPPY